MQGETHLNLNFCHKKCKRNIYACIIQSIYNLKGNDFFSTDGLQKNLLPFYNCTLN